MTILGIDPGTTRIGYGFIEKNKGLSMIDCGLINGEGIPKEDRLVYLEKEFEKLLKKTAPDLVCLERLFFSKNKKTASIVSEARGVMLLLVRKAGFEFMEFSPSEIKSSVVGSGRASKDDVKQAVMMTLGIKDIPGPDDVSDALAVALRGSFEMNFRKS